MEQDPRQHERLCHTAVAPHLQDRDRRSDERLLHAASRRLRDRGARPVGPGLQAPARLAGVATDAAAPQGVAVSVPQSALRREQARYDGDVGIRYAAGRQAGRPYRAGALCVVVDLIVLWAAIGVGTGFIAAQAVATVVA